MKSDGGLTLRRKVLDLQVFTDGSCYPNPGPEGGAGCVVLLEGVVVFLFARITGDRVTNNIAELEAIRLGLSSLPAEGHKITVSTDSTYARNVLTLQSQASANLDLVAETRSEMKRLGWRMNRFRSRLAIRHVYGHNGNRYNEMADCLARDPWAHLPNVDRWDDRDLYVCAFVDTENVPAPLRSQNNLIVVPRTSALTLCLP